MNSFEVAQPTDSKPSVWKNAQEKLSVGIKEYKAEKLRRQLLSEIEDEHEVKTNGKIKPLRSVNFDIREAIEASRHKGRIEGDQYKQLMGTNWDAELQVTLDYFAATCNIEVNTSRTNHLEEICRKIDPENTAPSRVVVMNKSETPTAFVTSDGTIFVSQSLINICDSDDDMAFILGHEKGHIKNHTHAIATAQNAFTAWGVDWIHEAIGGDQESINFMEQGGYKVSAAGKMLERLAGFERGKEHQSGVMRATQTYGNFAALNRTSSAINETPLPEYMKGKAKKTNIEIFEALQKNGIEKLNKYDADNVVSRLHPQHLEMVFDSGPSYKYTEKKAKSISSFYYSVDSEVVKRLVKSGHTELDAYTFIALQGRDHTYDSYYFIDKPEKFPETCRNLQQFNQTDYVNTLHKSVFINEDATFVRYKGDDEYNQEKYFAAKKFFSGDILWNIYDVDNEPGSKGVGVTSETLLDGLAALQRFARGPEDPAVYNAIYNKYFWTNVLGKSLAEKGFVDPKDIEAFFDLTYQHGYHIDGHDLYLNTRRHSKDKVVIKFNDKEYPLSKDQHEMALETIKELLSVEFRKEEKIEFGPRDLDRLFALFENPPKKQGYYDDRRDFASDILLKMSQYMGQENGREGINNEFADHIIKLVSQFRYKIPYSYSEYIKRPYVNEDGYPTENISPTNGENLDNESKLYGFHLGLVMLTQLYEKDDDEFYKHIGLLCETCEIDFDRLSKVETFSLCQEILLAEQHWAYRPQVFGGSNPIEIDFSRSRTRIADYEKLSEMPFMVRLMKPEPVDATNFGDLNKAEDKLIGSLTMFHQHDRSIPKGINIFHEKLMHLVVGQDILLQAQTLIENGVTETEFDELAKFLENSYPHNVEYQAFIGELDRRFLLSEDVSIRRKVDHIHKNVERIGYEGVSLVADQITGVEDFRYMKEKLKKNLQTYMEGTSKLSFLAIGDYNSQLVSDRFESVFETSSKDEESAIKTSTEAAIKWFSYISNFSQYGSDTIKFEKDLGKFSIERDASDFFSSVSDSFDRLNNLTEIQRFAIAMKLLVEKDGGLSSAKNRSVIAENIVDSLNIKDEFLRLAISSACTEADAKLVAIPVAQTLGPILFRSFDKNKVVLEDVMESVATDKYEYVGDDYKKVEKRVRDLFTREQVEAILRSNSRDIQIFGPEYAPFPNSAIFKLAQDSDEKYYSFSAELRKLLNNPDIPTPINLEEGEHNEIDPETEALIRAVESSGPLGGRSLQLTRQFENLSPEIDKRLSQSFDRNKGMDKFRFWLNLDKLAQENPEVEAFVHRIKLQEYKGGGSLQTTFRADYYLDDGSRQDVVLRMKNPNVELFVNEVYESAYKSMEKVAKEAKSKSTLKHARMAMMLLELSRQWCKADINDTEYEKHDDIFRRKIKKFNDRHETTTNTFTYAPERVLTHKQLKVESTGLGETLNHELNENQDSESKKKVVQSVSQFLLFQMDNPDYIDEQGEDVYVIQSDPHVGNYLVAYVENGGQFVGVLDRDFYLTLKKEDIAVLNEYVNDTNPKKFANDLIDRILDINKIRGMQRQVVKTNIFIKSGFQSLKDNSDTMTFLRVLLTEMEASNINTPLSIRLMLRNIEAAKRLNKEFGMELKSQRQNITKTY